MEHHQEKERQHQGHSIDPQDPYTFYENGFPNYFQSTPLDNPFQQHISTIPEGSTLRETPLPERTEKSPSPAHSSGQTTGTTSTPTSVDNGVALDNTSDRHNVHPPDLSHGSFQSEPAWRTTPLYGPNHTPSPQQKRILGHPPYFEEQGSLANHTGHSPPSPQRYNPANYPSAIKLLVSNNVAASIIGRAGQTVSELQAQSRTRIKLSQSGDFFPGTQDRVCLVQGETENVKAALRLLLERLFALQEHQYAQHISWQQQQQGSESRHPFVFISRLLVPNSCCGMIIGKAGANIKYLEESTGVTSVRLSPKDEIDANYPTPVAAATNERIVTVTAAHLDHTTQCLFLIVDSMATQPDICQYTNLTTSYARILSQALPIHGGNGLHLAHQMRARHALSQDPWRLHSQGIFPYGHPGMQRRFVSAPNLAGFTQGHPSQVQLHDYQMPLTGPTAAVERPLPFVQNALHGDTIQSSASVPIPATFMPPGPQPLHASSFSQQTTLRPRTNRDEVAIDRSSLQVHHSHSAPDLLAFQFEQSMYISNPPLKSEQPFTTLQPTTHSMVAPPHPLEGFLPQAPVLTAPDCFIAQALVPEQMVGSILGRAGTALAELQMLSGTRIRVSQRGEYMPGTRSRIVTVRGPSAQSVWQAQCMMNQRMVLPSTAIPPSVYSPGPPLADSQHHYASHEGISLDPATPPRELMQGSGGQHYEESNANSHVAKAPIGTPSRQS
ncbi:hypothetical protein MPSEU_000403000 [Mayamaea pseudoterrestris]|nr:hypothetical protein MPSEU_000403000 [Mayamaea pseudoterrestris]